MRFSDTLLGGFLLAFAAAIAAYSWTLPNIPGQEYGAATFPLLIAAGLSVCAVILIARGLRTGEPLVSRTAWTREPGAILSVVATVLVVLAYILFSRQVGFLPMMVAMLVVMFGLLKVRGWQIIPLAVATTLVIDFVFRSLLSVPLPLGVMPLLPW